MLLGYFFVQKMIDMFLKIFDYTLILFSSFGLLLIQLHGLYVWEVNFSSHFVNYLSYFALYHTLYVFHFAILWIGSLWTFHAFVCWHCYELFHYSLGYLGVYRGY